MARKVYMFLGIETYSWQSTDFLTMLSFCKTHRIDGVYLKVYEITQGFWYRNFGGYHNVLQMIRDNGIEAIPYGFFYGIDYHTEMIDLASLMKNEHSVCLNLESSWDNNANNAIIPLVNTLRVNSTNEVYISTWANPRDHAWLWDIAQLDTLVAHWMPEEYDDALIQMRLSQFPQVSGNVLPTYKIGGETIGMIAPQDMLSLWEYQDAIQNTQWVDSFVQLVKQGDTQVGVTVNKYGFVLDVSFFYQLEAGESQELCGDYGVSTFRYAAPPNSGKAGSGEQVDQYADFLADKYQGGHITMQGSSIPDMEGMLKDAKGKNGQQVLHYQEIVPSLDRINRAIEAGFGVLVTANEQNIRSVKSGARPPYPWNLNANHIIPLLGLDKNKNFLVDDYLNNNFQGEYPNTYDASVLAPSWACIVQVVGDDDTHPFQLSIPGPDPLQWPSGFNAQTQNGNTLPPVTQPPSTTNQPWGKQALDVWNSSSVKLISGSGIFLAWESLYGKMNLGPATTPEFKTVNWDNPPQPIVYQQFGNFHIEWGADNHARLFDVNNKLITTI